MQLEANYITIKRNNGIIWTVTILKLQSITKGNDSFYKMTCLQAECKGNFLEIFESKISSTA